jgi:hypothetical protein
MCKKCDFCGKSYAANCKLCPYCKRVRWIVQAWGMLLGWVDCKAASTLESATQQAASLASKSDAWMSSTPTDSLARATRNEWVRIIPLKYANTRNASEHNRISQEEHRGAERSCHHLFSGNKYFRGVDKSRRPGAVGSPTDDSVCVKCGFNSSWNAPLY